MSMFEHNPYLSIIINDNQGILEVTSGAILKTRRAANIVEDLGIGRYYKARRIIRKDGDITAER